MPSILFGPRTGRGLGIRACGFVIAGHGPAGFVERLRGAITDGPAAERIRLVPPQPEIWPLLAAVDVAAITTLWPDPLPRVVMEAMAVGKPVGGYAGGGVPEMVVDGETGLLCAPGDVGGLAAAFGRLAGDDDLRRRMGEAGRSAPANSSASSATWIGWRRCCSGREIINAGSGGHAHLPL